MNLWIMGTNVSFQFRLKTSSFLHGEANLRYLPAAPPGSDRIEITTTDPFEAEKWAVSAWKTCIIQGLCNIVAALKLEGFHSGGDSYSVDNFLEFVILPEATNRLYVQPIEFLL